MATRIQYSRASYKGESCSVKITKKQMEEMKNDKMLGYKFLAFKTSIDMITKDDIEKFFIYGLIAKEYEKMLKDYFPEQ